MRNVTLLFLLVIIASLTVNGCETRSYPTSTPIIPTPTTSNVEVFRNLVYVEPLQPQVVAQKLDVYKPMQAGNWPVVVLLHGLNAAKEGYAKESLALAKHGAVVFIPNWPTRIADIAAKENGKGFREIYEVLACAIRFARNNATEYDGNPSHLTLIGHSYGAAYGSWIALAGDDLDDLWEEFATERGGPPSQVECIEGEGSFAVDAFIGIAGRYNHAEKLHESDPELWNVVSTFAQVGRGPMLPVRLLHGERDTVVDPDISVQIKDILVRSDYDARLTFFDGIHQEIPFDLTTEMLLDLTGE
jgi:predicted esterase